MGNVTAPILPDTGGMGTTLFIVIGVLLMIFAIVLVVIQMKKRSQFDADEEDENAYEDDEDVYEERDE